MRIFDEQMNLLRKDKVDLSTGYLVDGIGIKENVTPIDNEIKFAWYDEDYEEIKIYILYTEEELNNKNVPSAD